MPDRPRPGAQGPAAHPAAEAQARPESHVHRHRSHKLWDVRVHLDVKQSPKTSASIDYLVKRGFYNGLTFHRVAEGFVIQGGDPMGNGSGGPGYTVVEAPPPSTQYVQGDVAMAKTEIRASRRLGSQFFVVTGANVTQSAGLTPAYALAGKVTSGIGVVKQIGSLPTNPPGDGMPSPSVVMSSVKVASH